MYNCWLRIISSACCLRSRVMLFHRFPSCDKVVGDMLVSRNSSPNSHRSEASECTPSQHFSENALGCSTLERYLFHIALSSLVIPGGCCHSMSRASVSLNALCRRVSSVSLGQAHRMWRRESGSWHTSHSGLPLPFPLFLPCANLS